MRTHLCAGASRILQDSGRWIFCGSRGTLKIRNSLWSWFMYWTTMWCVFLLLSLASPLVAGRLPHKNLQKSSRKSRLWVKRHFHQLENCLLVNFDVIEKMHAIPDLDCPSKIAQISSEIRGFRHVIFNNFRVFEALGESYACNRVEHTQRCYMKFLKHSFKELNLGFTISRTTWICSNLVIECWFYKIAAPRCVLLV